MNKDKKRLFFNPHGTARAESLAGVPLASFGQRLAAYTIGIFLVGITYGPAMAGLRHFFEDTLHLKEEIYQSAHMSVRLDFHRTTEMVWIV
jgi:hypothetical protein